MTTDAAARLGPLQRAVTLLARLPASVTGDLLPSRLLDDLAAVIGGDVERGDRALRLVVLWAPGARDSALLTALFGGRTPGDTGRRGAAGRHSSWYLPLRIEPRTDPRTDQRTDQQDGTGDGMSRVVLGGARLRLGPQNATAADQLAAGVTRLLRSGPPLPTDLAALADVAVPPSAGGPGRTGFPAEYLGSGRVAAGLRRRAALRELAAALGLTPDATAERSPPTLEVPVGEAGRCWTTVPVTVTVLPVVAPHGPDVTEYSAAALIRAELAGAHAVLGVVGYEDVLAGPGTAASSRPHLDHVGEWLTLANERVGPGRVTLAVDGVGRARSDPAVVRDWVRQRARVRLRLPAAWPVRAIIPVDADLALDVAGGGAARRAEEWAASGLPELLDRIVGPLAADPARVLAMRTTRELQEACAGISRRCAGILALSIDRGGRPPPRAAGAAQRRARLAATAGGPLAARVLAALSC